MANSRRVSGRGRRGASAPKPSPASEPILVVPLSVPIYDGAELVSELRFSRRPNFGDLEAADDAQGNMGRVVILVSRLACLTPREARSIDAADVEAVAEAVAELLGERGEEADSVPQTGEQ
jgi:hypothetical protein